MATYTIIGGDGKQYGPITAEELRKWMAEGRLNAQTLAKGESDAEFRPLSTFPEFADAFAPQAPMTGAPPVFSPAGVADGDYDLDIGGCFSRGWELVKANFWPTVGVTALVMIIIGAINQVIGLFTRPAMNALIVQHQVTTGAVLVVVLSTVASAPIYTIFTAGLLKYYLKLIRGEGAQIGDAFSGFGPSIGQLVLLSLVQMILVLLGCVLCLLPGIYLSVAWYLAMPLVIDRRMNFWDAMELSRKMVNKHWFIIFAFLVVYGLLVVAGLIACCVGIFVTMPIGFAALMYAYETVFSRRKPVSRSKAKNAALLNLLAAPGLGSLLCGRWMAGSGQLILAVAGLTWVVVWFLKEMIPYYGLMFSDEPPHLPGLKMLAEGATLFAASWLWSAVTSMGLLREASANSLQSLKNSAAPPMQKLEAARIVPALATVPQWQRQGDTIARTYQYKDFPAAMKFVDAVAGLAEQAWHHPDIDIRWNKVTLTLTTHDAGGLTEKDFDLARQFDQLSLR